MHEFSVFVFLPFFIQFWKAKNRVAQFTFAWFCPLLGSIFGAKFDGFSCYCSALFFDRFLKASGGILGGILGDFGR